MFGIKASDDAKPKSGFLNDARVKYPAVLLFFKKVLLK